MKQIVVISGKGGTGKTVITAAFAALAKNKVMADCDVDAADLHLLLNPKIIERHTFRSGKTAIIDKKLCQQCGKCITACRFNAISQDFTVDPISCEGCAFCSYICPAEAIKMKENISGECFISHTRFGPLVHARLGIAEENSGKLVTLVRQKAKELAENKGLDWVIVDGAPGIGCPVIASLSGVDFALVVTEPTLSGLHDARRVIEVARHFRIAVKLVVNKFDLNLDITREIEKYAQNNQIQLLGKICFDEAVVKAMVEGKTVVEFSDGKAKKEIINIWQGLEGELK
jgi:MinD superfamily P-loop ATPase